VAQRVAMKKLMRFYNAQNYW